MARGILLRSLLLGFSMLFLPAWVCPTGSAAATTRGGARHLSAVTARGRSATEREKEIQEKQDKEGLVSEFKTEYIVALLALILLGTVFNPFQ